MGLYKKHTHPEYAIIPSLAI